MGRSSTSIFRMACRFPQRSLKRKFAGVEPILKIWLTVATGGRRGVFKNQIAGVEDVKIGLPQPSEAVVRCARSQHRRPLLFGGENAVPNHSSSYFENPAAKYCGSYHGCSCSLCA